MNESLKSVNWITEDQQNRAVIFRDLGLIDYKDAWDIQETLFQEVIDRIVANRKLSIEEHESPKHYLLFCEHPHVFTLGRSVMKQILLSKKLIFLQYRQHFTKTIVVVILPIMVPDKL